MLFHKHRPRTLADVAGHMRQKLILQKFADSGTLTGRAYWITGLSGIGKSTLAGIIADLIAEPWNVHELDAGHLTPAKIEALERESRSYAIGEKPGRCFIVNEAHGLRSDSVRSLLTTLEAKNGGLPSHVAWIFTTTVDGMGKFDGIDSAPLLSRCLMLNLTPDREAFARRAMEIAEAEGLGDAPLAEYVRLMEFCGDNLRMALSQIETGVMLGEPA